MTKIGSEKRVVAPSYEARRLGLILIRVIPRLSHRAGSGKEDFVGVLPSSGGKSLVKVIVRPVHVIERSLP